MPANTVHAPTLGPDGEPCQTCAAPLAGDQRYCLECGTRRGAPRLDPVALARGDAPGVVAAPADAPGVAGVPLAEDAALPAAALALGRPRVAATAALLVLGFGVIVGIAAGPDSTSSLAAQRRIVVAQNPAPATTTTPAAGADTSSSTTDAGGSTTDSSSTSADTTALTDASVTPVDTSGTTTTSSGSGTSGSGTGTSGSGTSGSGTGDSGSGTTTTVPSSGKPPAPVKHVWVIPLTGQTVDTAYPAH